MRRGKLAPLLLALPQPRRRMRSMVVGRTRSTVVGRTRSMVVGRTRSTVVGRTRRTVVGRTRRTSRRMRGWGAYHLSLTQT
jgi:hypothetical protein